MSDIAVPHVKPSLWGRVWTAAREPVDAASLAVFRIALGLLIAYDALRKGEKIFGSNNGLPFRFPYEGFEWVPAAGSYAPLLANIWLISAICVTLGLFYRPAMILATVLTAFGFLQAEEFYLNHYYLLIIVCLLMSLVPANRAFALDPLLARKYFARPEQPQTVARMHMWLLKGQTEIVLIYAGLVKINADWLQLEPLRSWLIKRQGNVFFGSIWQYDWIVAAGNYGIIALHILGAPLLLWKRTRLPIFLTYCAFHSTNHFVFDIGIFPWMTIAMSALFFPTDWPRRALRLSSAVTSNWQPLAPSWPARAFAAFACVWLVSQALIPLRHYLYKGDVAWTYEGHRFAWRMKLIDRWSPGFIPVVYIPEQNLLLVPPSRSLLTRNQMEQVATRPRTAQKFAQQLGEHVGKLKNAKDVRVHLYYPVGYNNREATLLIDPTVNLVNAPTSQIPAPWIITHNDKPLRRLEQFRVNHDFPDFHKLTPMMGLPRPVNCHQTSDKWTVCRAEGSQQMSRAN